MGLDLVIDIGNTWIKCALFDGDRPLASLTTRSSPFSETELLQFLKDKPVTRVLLASVNPQAEKILKTTLAAQNIAYLMLDYSSLSLVLQVDEPHLVGHDRIANVYGALKLFPVNDCIVVDIGTAITVDLATKDGCYLGGMIYSGARLCAKALAGYTAALPLIEPKRPEQGPIGKTTQTHIESGIYYGQLGAIERMISELKLAAPNPSAIKIIATGGDTKDPSLAADLKELVDLVDPYLTLVGLHEILKELDSKKRS